MLLCRSGDNVCNLEPDVTGNSSLGPYGGYCQYSHYCEYKLGMHGQMWDRLMFVRRLAQLWVSFHYKQRTCCGCNG